MRNKSSFHQQAFRMSNLSIPSHPKKRVDDRVIRSIYTPKEIHYIIMVAFQEILRNDMSFGEKLLLNEFVRLLKEKFDDI